jgi:hypothetical protein
MNPEDKLFMQGLLYGLLNRFGCESLVGQDPLGIEGEFWEGGLPC